MLLLLAAVLVWRIVKVVGVVPPTFEEPPQVAAHDSLPPMPAPETPRGAAFAAINDGNLFETERGYREEEDAIVEEEVPEEPLPPPTNVVLNGVFSIGDTPMAILTDTNGANGQLTLQVGDNVGDYQVGAIDQDRVTLLGNQGQQFSLELAIKTGSQPGASPRVTPARGTPQRGVRPPSTPSNRPRPASQTAAERAAAARERAAAARERLQQQQAARAAGQNAQQTPAQRAAAARAAARARANNRQGAAQAAHAAPPAAAQRDPAEERLEALRRLREAAGR